MSRQRRSRHRVPLLEMRSDPISDRYQIEVDMATNRLEQRYRKAVKALEAAERRAERARLLLTATRSRRRTTAQQYDQLLLIVEERRRELRQIELLMIPATYNGRDSRSRVAAARHEAGAITIPLGATTGQRPKPAPIPVFPVTTR